MVSDELLLLFLGWDADDDGPEGAALSRDGAGLELLAVLL